MLFNEQERRRVEDKALEQILKIAQLARVDPQDLWLIDSTSDIVIRPVTTWSEKPAIDLMFDHVDDLPFLKDLGISPA